MKQFDFSYISNDKLLGFYSKWIKELKARKIIRTNNIVGELGEYLAIEYYNKTPGLPKLQATPISTKSIDAVSNKGERYSIKSVTGKTTGVFYGIDKDSSPEKLFEYVIIVVLDEEYSIDMIIEISWENFLKYKHWHSRMNAWNLSITKKLIKDSKIIFQRKKYQDNK